MAEGTGRVPPPEPAGAGGGRTGGSVSPIFVVGVARSGTTLLAAMLAAHSRLDCGPESRFFARLRHLDRAARERLLDPGPWPGPAVEFLASLDNQGHAIIDLFGLTRDEVRAWLVARRPSLQAMLEALVVQHAERRGKPRWVEKTPRHLLALDSLRQLWPDAHIVRIVRDPRDVALSLAGMPFAGDSLVGNLVRIDQDDRASRDFFARDGRSVSLRYEDLVTDPERELRRLCGFLGEAFEPAMLERGETAAGVAADHEWWKRAVTGPLDPSRVGTWRTAMPPDVQRFAALHLAGMLEEHGYAGSRQARGHVAIVPVADSVGARHEGLLLGLASRDLVVARPAPRSVAELWRQPDVVFMGVRGQLDPFREASPLRRAVALSALAAHLVTRRARRRPALWIARSTTRARHAGDAGELLVAAVLRLLARRVRPEGAIERLSGVRPRR
jgi:hypothetical protein